MKFLICIFIFFTSCEIISAQNDNQKEVEWDVNDPRWQSKIPNWWDEDNFVPPVGPDNEKTQKYWINQGQKKLKEKLEQKLNLNKAKNVVIFIGDGMGLGTLMATRSYMNDVSEELSFEKFPHTGLAKTYCINYQIPDSSCTATAILSGVKSNYGTLGVNGNVNLRECQNQNKANEATSIFEHAQNAGKSSGIVTTTRITHATPAAAYAHSSSRYWESNDGKYGKFEECDDIAYQLIYGRVGSRLNVAFGGGRRRFETNTHGGLRTDGKDLIREFLNEGINSRYIETREELMSADVKKFDRFLGLFNETHLEYKLRADEMKLDQPTLTEMTSKALEVLKKNDKGFILLVEGGRIDTAHHETKAKLALEEVREFHKAVDYVRKNTNEDDTLIIVTSDHSTVLTVGGYMPRGFNILGPGDYSQIDKKWFFSLSYANGPGYSDHIENNGSRSSPQGKHYLDSEFRQPTTVPEFEESHAGEDVAVFASGPQSHLFSGVYEQNYLAHAIAYATCLGPDDFEKHAQCAGNFIKISFVLMFIAIVNILFLR